MKSGQNTCGCCRALRVLMIAVITLAMFAVPNPVSAGCCDCTAVCHPELTEAECSSVGWVWHTEPCEQGPCLPFGACCVADGGCVDAVTEATCLETLDGLAFEMCATCDIDPCTVACCFCNGVCVEFGPPSTYNCGLSGGIPQGWGSTCATASCGPPRGACCLGPAGPCIDNIFQQSCFSGGTFYVCASCTNFPSPCAPPGGATQACCFCTGGCLDLPPSMCISGVPQGPGSFCSQVPCEERGACCIGGTNCQDNLSQSQCSPGVGMFYPCDSCANIECGTQACCLCNGLCLDLSPGECTGSEVSGIPQGPGSSCAAVVCPRFGVCCVGQACTENVFEFECDLLGGDFHQCESCASVTCTPTGACCFACTNGAPSPPCPNPTGPTVLCQVVTAAQCLNAGGVYAGDNTGCVCCPCPGDLNGDGKTNVADFNLMAANFGGGIPNCRSRAQGDLNCDGVVNTGDFNILAGNFGCARPLPPICP